MTRRFHPIEEGLWNDSKLEGLPFVVKGFFAWLCSNTRQRPSGIYRATDRQIAADTDIPEGSIREYMDVLQQRGRIVRDGTWVFVRNYLKRQPHHERLLNGVRSDIADCDSIDILKGFSETYPLFSKWSNDRLETVARPMHGIARTNTNTNTNNKIFPAPDNGAGKGKKTNPDIKVLVDCFHDEFKKRFHEAPTIGSKEAGLAKRLLSGRSIETLIKSVQTFIHHPLNITEERKAYSFGDFAMVVDRIIAREAKT